MKKSIKHILTGIHFIMVLAMLFVSCKKDGSTGNPSINGFRLYKQSPQDSIISPEGDIKAIRPGDMIVIEGNNLDNMKAVYFNGFAATINTVYSSNNYFVVAVPGNIPFGDIADEDLNTVKVVTAGGTAKINFPIAAPAPLITAISNELPNPGETIRLYGSGLFAITQLTLPGNITVPVDRIKSDPGGTFTEIQLPAGFTTQSGPIRITTKFGTSTSLVKLNDLSGMICNFDDINIYDAVNSRAVISKDVSSYPGAKGNYARMMVQRMPANDWNDGESGRRLILNYGPFVPVAELNSPTENWAVKFEIYVKNPWYAGCLFLHDWKWANTCRYEPWKVGLGNTYQTTSWTTVTLPLSNFKSKPSSGPNAGIDGTGTPYATLNEFTGGTGNYRLGFFFNNALVPLTNFDIAIDNIRVVRIK